MVDLEDPEAGGQGVGPPPGERVEPRPEQDVLIEAPGRQPVLGVAGPRDGHGAGGPEERLRHGGDELGADLGPGGPDQDQGQEVVEDPGGRRLQAVQPPGGGGHDRRPARLPGFHHDLVRPVGADLRRSAVNVAVIGYPRMG